MMEKVKVSKEVAAALDKQSKDEWSKQFKILSTLQPLEYAKCLLIGYETIED